MLQVVILFLGLILGNAHFVQAGDTARDGAVEAALVPEVSSVAPGRPFLMAVRLRMDEHWHTYWRNPGDSGLPTEVVWELPEGFQVGAFQWPAPERIEYGGVISYGHHGEAWLLAEVLPPENLPAEVRIGAKVSWLMCKESCIPGEVELELTLPRGAGERDEAVAEDFVRALAALPEAGHELSNGVKLSVGKDKTVELSWVGGPEADRVYFFAHDPEWLDHGAPQTLGRTTGGGRVLKLSPSALSKGLPEDVSGVLVFGPGTEEQVAVAVSPVNSLAAGQATVGAVGQRSKETLPPEVSLLAALFLAFVGGLILNVMPCVLPVISLKIFDFMKQAHGDARKVLAHGWAYCAGVWLSFNVLYVAILALRAAGERVGWAFQMQDPVLVLCLGCLLVVVTAALFGAIEIGSGLAGAGARVVHGKSGVSGSFLTGVLATVLATPCTAPFMGPAIGYALAAPVLESALVFQMLAVGMALPYLLLSLFPNLLKFLPKPGAWMESFKQFTGFLMLGALLWITWVYAALVEHDQLIPYFVMLGVVALCTWLVGRFAGPEADRMRKLRTWAVAAVLLAVAVFTQRDALARLRELPPEPEAVGQASAARAGELPWRVWSPEAVEETRAAGRPVFIDFTAAWCLVCKANEASSLNVPPTVAFFEEYGIVPFKADWTRRQPRITEAIESYGRAGVPVYVFYARPGAEPILLPEALTQELVQRVLSEALEARH